MASQDVTTTPTQVAGLTNGTTYTGQVRGHQIVKMASAASAPDADSDDCFVLAPGDTPSMKQTSARNVYIWSGAEGSTLVYFEAS